MYKYLYYALPRQEFTDSLITPLHNRLNEIIPAIEVDASLDGKRLMQPQYSIEYDSNTFRLMIKCPEDFNEEKVNNIVAKLIN